MTKPDNKLDVLKVSDDEPTNTSPARTPVASDETPETVQSDEVDDVTADPEDTDPDDTAEGTKGDETDVEPPRVAQGNTDPRDFDVFDSRGNYVEKRDR